MRKRKVKKNRMSPADYENGFNVALKEFDFFEQLKNRLRSIRATQQLKNGELFLNTIEVYQDDMREEF
jgi:hypothetical protein